MGDSFFEDEWMDDSAIDGDEFATSDPFDGLTRHDQDIFFKVLDIVPDAKRETAMDYFLDHPQKIKAVVTGVKLQKELMKNKDAVGLNKLFEQEHVLFQNADASVVTSEEDNEDNY